VTGVRQRTGTLRAAHALAASFPGATTIRAHGLETVGRRRFGRVGRWPRAVGGAAGAVAAEVRHRCPRPSTASCMSRPRRKRKPTHAGMAGGSWLWISGAAGGKCREGADDVLVVRRTRRADGRPDDLVAHRTGGTLTPWLLSLGRPTRSSRPRRRSVSRRAGVAHLRGRGRHRVLARRRRATSGRRADLPSLSASVDPRLRGFRIVRNGALREASARRAGRVSGRGRGQLHACPMHDMCSLVCRRTRSTSTKTR
jgi:hypothetical protein